MVTRAGRDPTRATAVEGRAAAAAAAAAVGGGAEPFGAAGARREPVAEQWHEAAKAGRDGMVGK